jgi:ATP-dependent exoDNAse (exonuclease V) alpha subunit
MHMTAHKSQGQTLGNAIVSADMNLDNPDKSMPADIGSVIYVALTRVRNLAGLLISQYFQALGRKLANPKWMIEGAKQMPIWSKQLKPSLFTMVN